MMEIRLKSAHLEPLFVCLCLLTVLGPANVSAVVRVREGSEAVLPCFIRPERNITRDVFEWKKDGQKEVFFYVRGLHYNNVLPGQDEQFKGRVSHFPEQLQSGDASIVIRDTKLSDSGTYTCDYSPDEPNRQTFNIDLVVDCAIKDRSEENIPGASLEPYVTLLDQTRDKAQLQCEVRRVSPKPKVKWQDSDGNILPAEKPKITERGGSYDIILQTTVTKTDKYRCVVTQEEICHQISDETAVYIYGAATKQCVTILHQTKDWALLQCEVRGASPEPKVKWQDSSRNILHSEEPQVTERGDSYDIILNVTVKKAGKYQCVVTQEEINHQTTADIYVPLNGPEPTKVSGSVTGWIGATSVLGILLFVVVVVVVVLAVLYKKRYISITYQRGSQTETEKDEEKNSSESVELNKKSDTIPQMETEMNRENPLNQTSWD